MIITLKQIKKLKPCKHGLKWGKAAFPSGKADVLELLLKCNDYCPSYARWLFTKLMNRKQCIEISIYAAQQVLHIFESKYPNDKRPREAIEAAKQCLKHNTAKNRSAAYCAANAATDAANCAYCASASYAARAAYWAAACTAHLATVAYCAANAAADAYWAAANAAADAIDAYSADAKKLQEKIIKKAVKILEG